MIPRVAIDKVTLLLFGIAGMLLLANLGNGYLWQDEAETALLARHTLTFGYPRASDGVNAIEITSHGHGPGETWIYSPWLPVYLLAAVFAVAGESTAVARLPFALLGWLTIALTWRLARRLTNDVRIHRLTVALLTFSVPFLLHMRQCRYYALATALVVGICLAYLTFFTRPTWRRALGLAGLLVLLFHTNFGTFIPTVAALFLHQAIWGTRQSTRPFLGGLGVVVVLTFPWALFFYQPAFIGSLSLERVYRHLEYYIRITNKFLIPLGFMSIVSLISVLWSWRTRRVRPNTPRTSNLEPRTDLWFFMLLVACHVAFLLVPDQRHMRYFMPVFPPLVIGEAWWLVSVWLARRPTWLGWPVVALVLLTTIPYSARAAVPLVDLVDELTHRYVGPMEGIVDHLRAHGRPGQVVKIPYDDRTLLFYTQMRLEPPSEFLRESYPDWIVIRRGWISRHFFASAYFARIKATYDEIVLDAPDAFWQNREDPGLHHFRRAWWPPPVIIYRKRTASAAMGCDDA